jgi:hypothetical protein
MAHARLPVRNQRKKNQSTFRLGQFKATNFAVEKVATVFGG